MTHHLDLDTLVLAKGGHDNPRDGACLLEAVALFADDIFSDSPVCVSPVLAAFGRSWNDALPDDERQQLKRYIPLLPGTAGDSAADKRRAWMATDWLVRVHTPAWLRLAGLTEQAERLEALPELTDGSQVPSIKPTLEAVRKDAAAAWDAAGDAAWDAAGDAAWDAAGDAAGAAAGAAAWDAAGAAAGDAAWDAAWDAAGDAAGDAARSAAWDAARDAAGAAARAAAWDAARAAAGAAARDAAWDAARAAAGAAARDAAGAAARAAAWDAARAAAWDAARAAARAAARDAAWDAARAAARAAARDAARDAARAALKPTRDELIQSAHQLYQRMIDVRVEVSA